jgi:hypothetical protein
MSKRISADVVGPELDMPRSFPYMFSPYEVILASKKALIANCLSMHNGRKSK